MATKPEDGMASLYRNLETATGKSIDVWVTIAKNTGIAKHKALVESLKAEHGLTHGYAHQIALRALAAGPSDDAEVDLVAAQYAGSKATLKPLYDALAATILEMGDDIELSPKKAYVSVRRSKQFAILQPAAGRIDIGIVLKSTPPTERLEAAGSFNTMVTHRVRVTSEDLIDDELKSWMRDAYGQA